MERRRLASRRRRRRARSRGGADDPARDADEDPREPAGAQARRSGRRALRGADARTFQGWAASPHLQVALVQESRGRLRSAREEIRTAIERDRSDWRLWAVAARIQEESGSVAEARRSYEMAKALNPRSPLFKQKRTRTTE